MAQDKISMPKSSAGLTSFYDESTSKILMNKNLVIGITVSVILITIILNVM